MNGRLQSVFDYFEETLPIWYGNREIRNSQVQMAVDIAGVLATDSKYKTILADAPVGTGKTFAVLVPALYDQNAGEFTKRIIYATASLNLQAQLKNEELQILKELHPGATCRVSQAADATLGGAALAADQKSCSLKLQQQTNHAFPLTSRLRRSA